MAQALRLFERTRLPPTPGIWIEDGAASTCRSAGMIRTGALTGGKLQGMRDEDVPFSHALALMQRFGGDPATPTLVKDGDHRLSRPQDLQLMFDALVRMM